MWHLFLLPPICIPELYDHLALGRAIEEMEEAPVLKKPAAKVWHPGFHIASEFEAVNAMIFDAPTRVNQAGLQC